ncbi:hypothetical protein CTEN210_00409 [Chaetoceros tenuissimus]|uniref:Exostosin GT47 domain-containing protein n=1 Tax=Chaetoceros tenuissimus TaxID=426638 RepID=A0AAD3CFZ7_9STRA|nr:hypothetical protein CTEN210_00409 [Chaetoceros tenuissimus]
MDKKYSLFILLLLAIVTLQKIYPITTNLKYHEDALLRGGGSHVQSINRQDLDDDEDYDEKLKESENLASNLDGVQEDDDDNDTEDTKEQQQEIHVNATDAPSQQKDVSRPLKFYILNAPRFTSDLIGITPTYNETKSQIASNYYANIADTNEQMGEIWLHRLFSNFTHEQGRTNDPSEADVFLIAAYNHLARGLGKHNSTLLVELYKELIVDSTKPHLLLTPTQNPTESRNVGTWYLSKALQSMMNDTSLLWSVGYERNRGWQGVEVNRIIPIPYVVRLSQQGKNETKDSIFKRNRTKDFVFYAGDSRRMAPQWAGCSRENITAQFMHKNKTHEIDDNIDIRIVGRGPSRLSQQEYNTKMATSEYCLILCGDTPTSRSFTSAMVHGCIPIRVGSRLRGLCEKPCVNRWGWDVSGINYPHLPYSDRIAWDEFPEVDEQKFIDDGYGELEKLFTVYNTSKKARIRNVMEDTHRGWVYGWGDPVTSVEFGEGALYIWKSFQEEVMRSLKST